MSVSYLFIHLYNLNSPLNWVILTYFWTHKNSLQEIPSLEVKKKKKKKKKESWGNNLGQFSPVVQALRYDSNLVDNT